jgi:hypothetical protein
MKMDHYKKQTKALEALVEVRPTLSLSTKDLPAIKNWKVGEEYRLEVIVKQQSLHQDEDGMRANFVIKKVSSLKP